MSETRKIIIADHHPLCAAALSAAAQGVDENLEIHSVESMSALMQALESDEYAVIAMSLGLHDGDGLRGLAELHSQCPDAPILVIHGEADEDLVEQAMLLGARGFLGATATLADVSSALAGLLDGGQWVPRLPHKKKADRKPAPLDRLSRAQKRVLAELSQGKGNREIAESLCLSEATIKSHLYAVYKELGVKNRTQALLKVQEM